MYKNVQVNHYNNAPASPTTTSRSSPSFLPFQANRTAASLSAPVTSASSSPSAISIARPPSLANTSISRSRIGDGGLSLPVSFDSPSKSMSLGQSSKLKSDVDQLDDLVKDLLIEVNRPIGTATTSSNRHNSTSSTNNTTNHNSNNNNNKYSTSSSSYSYQRRSNNENNEPVNVKLPSSVRASSYAQASTLNNQKRNEFDANTVSGLIDGSSNGVHREERLKSTREERIRIKRGGGGGSASNGVTDIPVTTSSSTTTTTTTTNKPAQSASSRDQLSIDEQLIDSLLESVQNTLRKRSQQQRTHQTPWTTDVPIHQQQSTTNRRTYSSSAAFPDTIHRVSRTNERTNVSRDPSSSHHARVDEFRTSLVLESIAASLVRTGGRTE